MLEFLPDAAALMAELGAVYRLEVLLRLLLDQGYRSPFMALFFLSGQRPFYPHSPS